jgi:type IX secretion system substrate protein
MKKLLLTIFAVGVCYGTYAQSNRASNSVSAPKRNITDTEKMNSSVGPVNESSTRYYLNSQNVPNQKSAVVNVIPIGNAPNTFGSIGARTQLFALPSINSVAFVHRATTDTQVPLGPGSGYFWYDLSTDGGMTFSINNGPIYNPEDTVPVIFANGRYPQGVVYNPPANTDPNNAYLSWHAPTLTGGNGGSWGSYAFGSAKLDGSSMTQSQETNLAVGGQFYQVPDDMAQGIPGEVWTIEGSIDLNNAMDYVDTVMVRRGLWNGSPINDYAYTDIPLAMPLSVDGAGGKQFANSSIAFGANGMTGYVSVIGHMDYTFEPDSVLYLITRKTTDGGQSWSAPIQIEVSSIADPLLASDPNGSYTVAFELKTAVDINGDLHIVCAIGPDADGFSITTTPGTWGIFDIFTTDGGNTWTGLLLGTPQQFRGNYDVGGNDLSEDSRPYITTTMNHEKLFFSWLDTDTLTFTTIDGNAHPDLWVVGYNATTMLATTAVNFTVGTAADGEVSYGVASKYTFEPSAGTYEVPYCYMVNDPLSSSVDMKQHNYIQNITFVDADFTVGVNEINNDLGTLSGLYPNPMNNVSYYDLNLDVKGDVVVTITNVFGQIVRVENKGQLTPGYYNFFVEKGNLSSGLYLINVSINNSVLTQKLIIH